MASSLKRHKARTPFLFHPDRKCILVSPSWAGCSGIFKIDGAGPGRLSYAPHAGWMLFWDSGRARSGRPPLPRGPRACSGAAAAGAGPGGPGAAGAGGRGPRECGDRDPSALRLRLEARVRPPGAERPRVRACVCAPPPPQSAGEGAETPSPPLLRTAPRPKPLTRLGCLALLRAPQCQIRLRLQLGFALWLGLPLRFPLGCCCARALARTSRGAHRSASACLARRGGAWRRRRGRAEPTSCPRSPVEATTASRGRPCPALPQPRPATHSTVARSGAPGGDEPPGP